MKKLAIVGVAAVISACSGVGGGGAQSGESAATGATSKLEVKVLKRTGSKPAPDASIDKQFRPDFTDCTWDISYLQVSGSKHDKEINAILARGNDGHEDSDCEAPEDVSSNATLSFLDEERGVIAVAESGYWDGGGAHPSMGVQYKNIDLTTGKEIKLSDLLKDEGATESNAHRPTIETIKASMIGTVGSRKWFGAEFDKSGHRISVPKEQSLDDDERSALRGGIASLFTKYDDKANKEVAVALGDVTDFAIAANGIAFDPTNALPHATQALGGPITVRTTTLAKNKMLQDTADAKRILGAK